MDFAADILYFINSGNNTIIHCDLEGRNCMPLISTKIEEPRALTVYQNDVYVSGKDKIVVLSKDGTQFKELRNSTPEVHALLLYDSSMRQSTGGITKTIFMFCII